MMHQQRPNGFNICTKESLVVVGQSLQTLKMLEESGVVGRPLETATIPLAFDPNRRSFIVGQWIDAKDSQDKWVDCSNLTSSKRQRSSK